MKLKKKYLLVKDSTPQGDGVLLNIWNVAITNMQVVDLVLCDEDTGAMTSLTDMYIEFSTKALGWQLYKGLNYPDDIVVHAIKTQSTEFNIIKVQQDTFDTNDLAFAISRSLLYVVAYTEEPNRMYYSGNHTYIPMFDAIPTLPVAGAFGGPVGVTVGNTPLPVEFAGGAVQPPSQGVVENGEIILPYIGG